MTIIQSLQPLFDELRVKVFEKLPKNLYYHNLEHTQIVMDSALELADAAALSPELTRVLYAAAMLHDTGFGKKYGANESVAAMLADRLLPKYNFTSEEIKQIHNMILATNQLIEPQEYLEMLLVDSDMGYLAKKDYLFWSNRLFNEWRELGLFMGSNADWLNSQIAFLENHSYSTSEAKSLYSPGLSLNLNQLKELTEWPF